MQRRWRNSRKMALRTTMPILRRLPPRWALRAVGAIGRLEHRLMPGLRSAFDEAVQRHADYFGVTWPITEVGRELAANQVRHRARDLLIDGRTDQQLAGVFQVEGRHHLDEALARGRGVVLLGNHFGAHLLMACWMIRQGYDWRMFGERPRHVSQLLARHFASEGPTGQSKLFISRKANPAEAAGAILRAARALRSGIVLSIAADVRWNGPLTTPATFLGQTYTFSSTWVSLAAMTQAPVVPAFCAMKPDGTYAVAFEPPWTIPAHVKDNAEATARWVQASLDRIEDWVRNDPANSIDYFFWTPTDAEQRALARAG